MAQAQYGNQIALYISLGFSKLSTILLTQRLFIRDMKKAWLVCQIMTGIIIVWTFSAPFLVSVGCSSASLAPKAPSQTCHNIIDRYKALVVTDAFTDLILTIVRLHQPRNKHETLTNERVDIQIPASLCWKLQMSTTLKLQVLAVFAFRLPLIILASLFLKTWELSLSSNNPGVDRAPAVIFQQTQICVSLMAATIPCLKSFIRSFDTGSGVKANFGSSEQYGSGGRGSNAQGGSQSYRLSSMNRSKASGSRSESQTRLRLDNGDVKVDSRPYATGRSSPPIRNKGKRESDGDSQGSGRELYIRRDMHFEVTSEDARRVPGMEHPGMLRLPA